MESKKNIMTKKVHKEFLKMLVLCASLIKWAYMALRGKPFFLCCGLAGPAPTACNAFHEKGEKIECALIANTICGISDPPVG